MYPLVSFRKSSFQNAMPGSPLAVLVCSVHSKKYVCTKFETAPSLLSFPPYFYFPLSCISRVPSSSSLPPTFARREYILFLSLSTPPFSQMARKRTREKKKRGGGGRNGC